MKPQITKATIGRLHNLGNYEHIRYEVTVEIPEGNHAGAVIDNVTKLLGDLEPKNPVSEYDLRRAQIALSKPESEWEECERGNKAAYEAYVKKHEDWRSARKAAHAALGDLPVESTYKDAKDEWDE